MRAICVGAELVLSPKVEDRFCRYRFVPEGPEAPDHKGSGARADGAIWLFDEPGAYQIGKSYKISLTVKEA